MTAEEYARCFVPVEVPVRLVRPGDVLVGKDGRLWAIEHVLELTGGPGLRVRHGDQWFDVEKDPDDRVRVLVEVAQVRAAELLVEDITAAWIAERAA